MSFSFGDLERIIGGPLLPHARKYTTFWTNSHLSGYSHVWLDAGYRVSLRGAAADHVGFRRAIGRRREEPHAWSA